MMDLSKPLQEDIRKNQYNLKVAIQNHQALVLKLKGNIGDATELKLKLADIQKHIISLGDAQKVLVARVKKEITAKSWSNNNNNSNSTNNNSIKDEAITSSETNCTALPSVSPAKVKTESNCREETERSSKRSEKRKREELLNDYNDEDNNDEHEDEEVAVAMTSRIIKKCKPTLSNHRLSRPSVPTSQLPDFKTNNIVVASSSDDSRGSNDADKESNASEVSKNQFMDMLGLITKATMLQLQSKNRERRRRRLAGHHSLYTSHWDLTVQRRSRTRVDRESEQPQEFERESSPIGSPPIIEVKKDRDSSSDSVSPSPSLKTYEGPCYNKNICVLCRKQGILSVCDNCSATYHWVCLDKSKTCPQCQVGQVASDSRSTSPNINPMDDTVSKVLGDTSKPPTRVSSMEVIARYFNRNKTNADSNIEESMVAKYAERLKEKKNLEARNASLTLSLATLEEKAAQLSASLVSQTANIKELSAGEDKIRERIKRVIDFISSMKTEKMPS